MIGFLFYCLSGRRRREICNRIEQSIGDKSSRSPSEICRSFYRHFGLLILELFMLPGISSAKVKKLVSAEQVHKVTSLLDQGRGVIIVTGHFSNWELSGLAFSLWRVPANSVAKPLKNKYFNKVINAIRSRWEQTIIPQGYALPALLRYLNKGKSVSLLLDHDVAPEKGGIFVPFFHKPSATLPVAALLSRKTKCPVIVARLVRVQEGRSFYYEMSDPIEPVISENKERDIYEMTKSYNQVLEKFILEHPEQWLWFQRRWRFDPH